MEKKVVIVGVGSLAEALASRIQVSNNYTVRLIIDTGPGNQRLQQLSDRIGSDYLISTALKSKSLLEKISSLQPEYIFSADNQRIFSPELLSLARVACINFHNGPLPHYRGVNIPTWAIWNSESMHAISWHIMLDKIDAGMTILEKSFEISDKDTAFSLSLKCIQAGIDSVSSLFKLLPQLDSSQRQPPETEGRYFSREDIPNNGILDGSWNAAKLDRLYRALNYKTIPNYVDKPLISYNGQLKKIKSLKWLRTDGETPILCDNQFLLEKPDGRILITCS